MNGPRYTPKEMIAKLVAFDTTSRNSNLPLIDFVADYLKSHGVAVTLVHNPDRSKANLYATAGPAKPGGIVLSAHTDVVPVDGQDWQSDPFGVVERNGKLFGRGTTDMKSFAAVALALLPDFLKRGLQVPLHIALSYDEEVGCLGAPSMIAHMVEHLPKPQAVIVGEPTNMAVVDAHKGIRAFRTTVHGHEMHSSQTHRGVNAIEWAAALITYIGDLGREMQERGNAAARFEPPYTTVHVGVIEGGTALNIVPRLCRFAWEYRPLPGSDEEEIITRFEEHVDAKVRPRLKVRASEADVTTERGAQVPTFRARASSPARTLALKIAGQNATAAVSYGTEAGLFEEQSLPTIVCGPGDIAQAHQPNEFVTLEQIESCTRFFQRLMDHVCAG
jgi:acetylornithine deacetylase